MTVLCWGARSLTREPLFMRVKYTFCKPFAASHVLCCKNILLTFVFFSFPVRRPQPQRPQFGGGGGGGGGVVPVTAVFPQQPGGGIQPRVSQQGVPQQMATFGTCIMPGCPYPKRVEGSRVHEYCSRTCAQKHRAMPASGHMQNHATAQQYGMWHSLFFLC